MGKPMFLLFMDPYSTRSLLHASSFSHLPANQKNTRNRRNRVRFIIRSDWKTHTSSIRGPLFFAFFYCTRRHIWEWEVLEHNTFLAWTSNRFVHLWPSSESSPSSKYLLRISDNCANSSYLGLKKRRTSTFTQIEAVDQVLTLRPRLRNMPWFWFLIRRWFTWKDLNRARNDQEWTALRY